MGQSGKSESKSKPQWQFINRLEKGTRVLRNLRPFDIETDGLGGDFIAVGWLDTDGETVLFSEDWLEFIETALLTDDKSLWVAHNLGRYETLYFLDQQTVDFFIANGWEIEIIGRPESPCILVITHIESGRQVKIWDSYSLIRVSLAAATETFNRRYKKAKGAINFETETFDLNNPVHKDYLRFDVLSLKELTDTFPAYFKQVFGVNCGFTLPSSGVRAWRKTIPPNIVYRQLTRDCENFARAAYRGGRVLCIDNKIHESVYKLDFNSMYPAVMREFGVPTGQGMLSKQRLDLPGFVKVLVNVPEDTPIWRCVLADENNVYGTGTFQTVTTTLELDQAEHWGTKVLMFIEGCYFNQIEKPFDDFVNGCERARLEAKKKGDKATEKIVKLTQNSVYGKFGQSRESKGLRVCRSPEGVPVSRGFEETEHVWEIDVEIQSREIMPHWAAWITAASRIKLLRECDRYGLDHFYYADTDSLLVSYPRVKDTETNPPDSNNGHNSMVCVRGQNERKKSPDKRPDGNILIGERYGQLKNEGKLTDFFVIAPKTYSGIDESGEHSFAVKGIPNKKVTRAMLADARKGNKVRIDFNMLRSPKGMVSMGRTAKTHRTIPTPFSTTAYDFDPLRGTFNPKQLQLPNDYDKVLSYGNPPSTIPGTDDLHTAGFRQ